MLTENKNNSRLTLRDSFKLIFYQTLLIGILIFINTAYLNLGDAKFGKGGWVLYWPLWSIKYLIPLIGIILVSLLFKLKRNLSNIICYCEIIIAVIGMELIWIFDANYVSNFDIIGLFLIFTTVIIFFKFVIFDAK